MAATYTVEWIQPGILLLRRTGLMSVDEASEYAATAARMVTTAPARWGAVVDVRGAVAQTDEVQQIVQRIIQAFVVEECRADRHGLEQHHHRDAAASGRERAGHARPEDARVLP